ncbi:hypothetical protein Airi02_055350 [Actinoallomurus iriomotensis]|uniref:Uncharacterized protein n=1 Tax=Actinoallomurus iriomotensis TaxID=478107 RepID=A0A9W6W346_9ACTN|nr:hypothetical protein Airi02_055350 [Actinoallomurus iriomotensis]
MRAAADTVAGAIDSLGGRALVVGLSLGDTSASRPPPRRPEPVAGLVAMGCTLRPAAGRRLLPVRRATGVA